MELTGATINGSEIVTKGNYHTLAARKLNKDGLVLSGKTITIGGDGSDVNILGNVRLPEGIGMSVEVVSSIDDVVKEGVIYLVRSSAQSENDSYDEYMLITDPETGQQRVEKLNSPDVSLTWLDKDTIVVLQSYGLIQEAGNDLPGPEGPISYIDDRIKAALNNGRVLDEQVATSMQPENVLREGTILRIEATGDLDLTNIQVMRLATAEMWVDVPAAQSSCAVTWTSPESASVTCIEGGTLPSTLSAGYRYVFVIRNDSAATGKTHYVVNMAYRYPLSELS